MRGLLGIDVGTGSVRGCIFDQQGNELVQPYVLSIKTKKTYDVQLGEHLYAQSSADIWRQTTKVIEHLVKSIDVEVIGIGFDATCSLVLLDTDGDGVPLDEEDGERDHRARDETDELNQLNCKAHTFVGGSFSAEMEIPKLMWLKRHSSQWSNIDLAMDMVDFMSYKATGSLTRSVCPLVCKWGWVAGACADDGIVEGDWEDALLDAVDLREVRHLARGPVKVAGASIPGGVILTSGLPVAPGTACAVGLIDAHAGALGIEATKSTEAAGNRVAIIAGTSTCHMALTGQPVFVPGVWGPYHHAVTANSYLLEGGQTSAGSTLDWIVKTTGQTHQALSEGLNDKKGELLIIPDFHGNRAPLSDPDIRGSIHGISIETSPSDLYLATIQGLAMGSRLIMETIEKERCTKFEAIVITGGLTATKLFVEANANAAQVPVIVPNTDNGVLLGASMLAGVAAGCYTDLVAAQATMSSSGTTVLPNKALAEWYDEKFHHFKQKLMQK